MKELRQQLIAVFVVTCCLLGCSWYNSYKKAARLKEIAEMKHNDSIRKAFVADSLANDQHYQDSIRVAEEDYRMRLIIRDSIEIEELMGFMLLGDSVYHTTMHAVLWKEDRHCHNYSEHNIPELRFVTRTDVQVNRVKLCDECEEIEDVYDRYNMDDLLDRDYVRKHYIEL